MMATERSDITSINRIASYLKVPAGKVGVNKENVSGITSTHFNIQIFTDYSSQILIPYNLCRSSADQ